jgi:uncharacterized protein YPO0396
MIFNLSFLRRRKMDIGKLFGGGGIFGALLNVASLMTPYGWAMQAAKMLLTAVGQELIQKLGDALSLPQSVIDAAQGALCAAAGDMNGVQRNVREAVSALGEEMNFSPQQQGEMERTGNQALDDFISSLSESEEFKEAKASGKGGGGWLMALAASFGKRLNDMARDIKVLGDQITKETPDKTAKFGAATQEFGLMMNAVNNALKTLGESLTTTARKG